jgi:hypothetical protein
MSTSTFFRLLTSPIPAKGNDLRQGIAALNQGQPSEEVFQATPVNFTTISGSPFAYWFDSDFLHKFYEFEPLESNGRVVRVGLQASDDFRFLRCWWEVNPIQVAHERVQTYKRRWVNFAKGGSYSPYYSDLHLLVDWNNDGEVTRESGSAFIRNENLYFLPGLTYPRLPHKRLSVRILPKGCIFSVNGPSIFWTSNNIDIKLLAVLNSQLFSDLLKAGMGRGSTESSGQTMTVQVGFFQNLPICNLDDLPDELIWDIYKNVRQSSVTNETTHVFSLPALLSIPGEALTERLQVYAQVESRRQTELIAIQAEIDARVAELYGVPELGQASTEQIRLDEIQSDEDESLDEDGEDELIGDIIDPASLVADLLMWCVGVAFGRWDVRKALDTSTALSASPSHLPELPGPFDPLPVCSPGMLTGSDGLPMRPEELHADYPLPIAWDGFLVDDPDHPSDIVCAVERTLLLIWHGRLEEIEREACEILGIPDLRAWFRDPKGFFAYHIKRYSKSRRKAPIYWTLQSAKRGYTIWLYYPRLNPSSLYHAGRVYGDAKLKLETGRLADWQRTLVTSSGSARKIQERKIARQQALVDELKAFVKALDAAALLELKPDLNDGVLLNIAPLHELVPWKEASRAWGELLRGKYEWSNIGKQLKERRLTADR